jgi:hypothetical protein
MTELQEVTRKSKKFDIDKILIQSYMQAGLLESEDTNTWK